MFHNIIVHHKSKLHVKQQSMMDKYYYYPALYFEKFGFKLWCPGLHHGDRQKEPSMLKSQ
jgi:hypothetical protein